MGKLQTKQWLGKNSFLPVRTGGSLYAFALVRDVKKSFSTQGLSINGGLQTDWQTASEYLNPQKEEGTRNPTLNTPSHHPAGRQNRIKNKSNSQLNQILCDST